MKEVVQIQMQNWAALIQQRMDSGLTVKEWCARNQVSEAAYYYRLKQLRCKTLENAQQQSHVTQFARLPDSVTGSSSDIALRIRCGSFTIEVSNDASAGILNCLKDVMLHAF